MASSKTPVQSAVWEQPPRRVNPRCARSPSMGSVSLADPRPRNRLRERLQSDKDRFVRYNAAIALARRGDQAAMGTLREMLATADLGKVIDLPGESEKQNKIEAIEIEALEALRTSSSAGKPELAEALRPQITDLTKSGLVSVRSQANELLQSLQTKTNYTAADRSTGPVRSLSASRISSRRDLYRDRHPRLR